MLSIRQVCFLVREEGTHTHTYNYLPNCHVLRIRNIAVNTYQSLLPQ